MPKKRDERPVHLGPPDRHDLTIERLLAIAEKFTTTSVVVLVVMSEKRCKQLIGKLDRGTTLHGVELRSNPFMPNDIVAMRYSDSSWKFFSL